jgi:hypothetical protein
VELEFEVIGIGILKQTFVEDIDNVIIRTLRKSTHPPVPTYQLLQLHVSRLHALHNIGKKATHIFSNRHRRDGLFYGFHPPGFLTRMKFFLIFVDFT